MSAEYEPDLELRADLNRLVIVPAASRTWSDVEARARNTARAPGRLRKPGLRIAVYASVAAVVVAAIAIGSVVGAGHLGQRRFALVIPEAAYAGTGGAQSGHWERSSFTSEGSEVRSLVMDPSNPSVVYAATEEGVFKTTDGAGSWKKISTTAGHFEEIALDPASPSTVYLRAWTGHVSSASMPLTLLRSDDGGATWTDLSGSGLPWLHPTMRGLGALWFDPTTTPSTLYMDGTLSSSESPPRNATTLFWWGVCRSTDRGKTWSELTLEEAVRANKTRPAAAPGAGEWFGGGVRPYP